MKSDAIQRLDGHIDAPSQPVDDAKSYQEKEVAQKIREAKQ
ncbi:hypothetical protein [Halochromatium roseum]|nr:hypothetical protein [Halochromatium roseum]